MGGRAVKGYSRREFVKSSAVGLAGLSAGCPRVRRASAAGKGEVEQVTVGLVQEAFTVDPHMNFSRYNLDTVNQIFEQLVHRDAKAKMVPGLALHVIGTPAPRGGQCGTEPTTKDDGYALGVDYLYHEGLDAQRVLFHARAGSAIFAVVLMAVVLF